jgi:hypothetical protein
LDELVEVALRSALEEVNAEAGSILLADPESKQLVLRSRSREERRSPGIRGLLNKSSKPASR